jgi:DNA-directed RNA polymerase subunit M/transcription elongation factor TFIIS
MHAADAAGDYLRLAERYRQMKDAELLVLLRQNGGLTDLARQALEAEIYQRRLEPEPEEPPPPIPETLEPSSADSPDEPDPYKEDRELVDLCTVWSLRDALQLQTLLDRAGIPFFMGPEKATGVAEVTSNFANGVNVQVMRIGIPWTRRPMSRYFPEDAPPEGAEKQLEEVPMRCPKCQSEEVIFNGLVTELPDDEFPSSSANESPSSSSAPDSPQKFEWTCDSCGYEWTDDGVARNQ